MRLWPPNVALPRVKSVMTDTTRLSSAQTFP